MISASLPEGKPLLNRGLADARLPQWGRQIFK